MYSRQVGEQELTFGVSGRLYKANVLMYDRQTESLWSQIRREAVTGPMTGTRLKVLPSTLTTWQKWLQRHPQTEVLSMDTGYSRDYSRDPYADYYQSRKGFFSFFKPGPGEEEKALVAGIALNGSVRAYPLALLREKKVLRDNLGGTALTLAYDPKSDQTSVRTADNKEIVPLILYWFVWKGMYPDSGLFKGKED
ncbi:MAG: DUF3179 domain-containing protein [Deltaproteobacteria bacterium]|nr:DUF3179 domain-containing protein [Deltaproteobacteria bacterium]